MSKGYYEKDDYLVSELDLVKTPDWVLEDVTEIRKDIIGRLLFSYPNILDDNDYKGILDLFTEMIADFEVVIAGVVDKVIEWKNCDDAVE